jgi:Mg-chelatase subunit ChlD
MERELGMPAATTTGLSLNSNCDLSSVAFNVPQKVEVLASIKGCSFENLARSSRAAVDLFAVIDKSASMKERMPLVKDTLRFMVQQLKEQDRLGIIFYDESVEIVAPLWEMTAEGKHRVTMAIDALALGGQTNTSAALMQALDIIRKRPASNNVVSVLLFTDGKANIGITKSDGIRNAVKGFLSQIDAVCSIFTFGYGTEIDPTYLNGISDVGNGMYYNIDSLDAIPKAFSDCLGGLLSIVAQKLTLTITAPKNHTLIDVKTGYSKRVTTPGHVIEVSIEDVYSEEQKDVLCVVELPALEKPSEKEVILEFDLKYTNMLQNKSEFQRCFVPMIRLETSIKSPEVLAIDKQKNRLVAADALRDAAELGRANNYKAAHDLLLKAEQFIAESPSAPDPYCQELRGQVQATRVVFDGAQRTVDKSAAQATTSQMYSWSQSHSNQRSTHTTPTYTTSSKKSAYESYTSKKH